jgi:hypothetical protein
LSRGCVRVSSASILNLLAYLEIALCIAGACLRIAKKQWKDYFWLGCFLLSRAGSDLLLSGIHRMMPKWLGVQAAYASYFFVYWFSFAVEAILALMIVYGVFRLAMAPLKGLQTLGMLVFKWAAGISVAVALGSAFTPNSTNGYVIAAISQLQRTQSILTVCLLLFVCFAIRPMGLSYGSRIFGVGLGLGIMSTNDLVQSAWLALHSHRSMGTMYNVVNGLIICVVLATWTTYFALPEPKRRMIVLPTTSPFLRWNQISQALGDEPGFVAVGGIPPEVFAPAELEIMRRASAKMPASAGAPAPKVTDFPLRRTATRAI